MNLEAMNKELDFFNGLESKLREAQQRDDENNPLKDFLEKLDGEYTSKWSLGDLYTECREVFLNVLTNFIEENFDTGVLSAKKEIVYGRIEKSKGSFFLSVRKYEDNALDQVDTILWSEVSKEVSLKEGQTIMGYIYNDLEWDDSELEQFLEHTADLFFQCELYSDFDAEKEIEYKEWSSLEDNPEELLDFLLHHLDELDSDLYEISKDSWESKVAIVKEVFKEWSERE